MVACRSCGETGPTIASYPTSSVAPKLSPGLMPPPASALPQKMPPRAGLEDVVLKLFSQVCFHVEP